jgi:hypothetical protein
LGNTPVSRRHFQCGENAPTAVGGYIPLANPAKYELSRLRSRLPLLVPDRSQGAIAH